MLINIQIRAHDEQTEFHEHAIAQHNEAIARHKRLKSACRADAFAHFDKEETESDGTSASGTE